MKKCNHRMKGISVNFEMCVVIPATLTENGKMAVELICKKCREHLYFKEN